ncbi:MFS transporter [Clostridium bowmanii]|uniref:MFS transporter n=1 Tax=Clostridium bowmanii TaxID=132925 RepID=UPI001C0B3EC9|nr:MFS transporter [Clostridium bowmanii]MBU3191142.1 MFS transporter [Clostridium bowmanii]MCA1075533.1 MFS transporter [Clostridium bowmanii]
MKRLTNCFKPYKGLPMSIYVLFLASIINNTGNFVGPFLTMFLTYRIGISVSLVGVIVAVNACLGMIGTMLGGKLIDSIGRKKVLVVFGFAAGIGYGLCAFINNPIIITSILMVSSFVGGFSHPVYSTITTDLTQGDQRNAAFSLNYMAINIGFSVGPLLAGFLYKNYLMWFFLGDAITTFLSIALISIFVPESMPTKEEIEQSKVKTNESAEDGSLVCALLKRPTLLMFSFIIVIYFIVFSQFTFGLSIQVGDIFKNNGPTIFGSLMTVNAVICSVLTIFITSATKNIKASLCIVIGGLLYAVGFGMMFFINEYYLFILSAATWTVGEILVATNTSVYIASQTPITHRGRFNSVFPIIRKLGFMIGPMMAGFYIKYTNIRNLWFLVAILALIASLLMYRLYAVDKV